MQQLLRGESEDPLYLPERNAAVAQATSVARADALRGRGAGKYYTKRDGRHEHRGVAEAMLGHPLQKGEVVHPKDRNIKNNDHSNLEVFASQDAHARHHGFGQ